MVACGACKKFISPVGAATCGFCAGLFHKACLGIPESTTLSKDWACPGCKKKTKKGDNMPIKGLSVTPASSTNAAAVASSSSTSYSEVPLLIPPADMNIIDMRREMAEYMAELRLYRSEMVEFRATVAAMNDRMVDIERRLDVMEAREEASGAVAVAELEKTVTKLKCELNDRDQEALLTDLDIGPYPEVKGENPIQSAIVLAAKLGVSLDSRDIVFAERVGRPAPPDSNDKRGPRRLMVRLARRHLRDELLSAARVRRELKSTELDLPAPGQRIYVNKRLTRDNRQLFHRVREECKERKWRYSWTKNGRPYAR